MSNSSSDRGSSVGGTAMRRKSSTLKNDEISPTGLISLISISAFPATLIRRRARRAWAYSSF
jgi:hypothetical protein